MLQEVRRCEGVVSSNYSFARKLVNEDHHEDWRKKEHTPRIFEVVIVPYVRIFDEERHGGRRGKVSVSH
jgi:hypothetical protein